VKLAKVAPFRLDVAPLTNAEYARFVRSHTQWRRDRVGGLFADDGYLQHWSSTTEPGPAIARQPVTQVVHGVPLCSRATALMRARLQLLACVLFAMWMAGAQATDRSASLYQLHERLQNQDGKLIDLDVYRGQKVLVAMFYGSCPATCPLIIDTLRAIERKADASVDLRVLLVSFDTERDTPTALRELATVRHIDTARWTLAHADMGAVRRIAAALNVQYKKLPSGDFSHSTIISVLDRNGGISLQSAELGHADPEIVRMINAK
jgi:protein SCO1/2